jgi:hypothetical protein
MQDLKESLLKMPVLSTCLLLKEFLLEFDLVRMWSCFIFLSSYREQSGINHLIEVNVFYTHCFVRKNAVACERLWPLCSRSSLSCLQEHRKYNQSSLGRIYHLLISEKPISISSSDREGR